jgi:hypothetical protein
MEAASKKDENEAADQSDPNQKKGKTERVFPKAFRKVKI